MPSWAKWAVSLMVAVGLIWVGWRVSAVLVTLHIVVCFVLVIVIMLQSGSAADLAGAFGGAGSQTAFGPRGAATFLSRATTWCAIVFMMTSLTLSFKRAPNEVSTGSILEQTSTPGSAPAKQPAAPPIQLPVQPAPQAPSPALPTTQPTPGGQAPAQQQPATPAPGAPAPAPQPTPKK
ncbi:MAG TPA: preprotein translocase subunit SecG [Candidatus Acidoferrales bacterium]|nr:preprotein translocase subunit SecG [Candidatus Acidoferrales bacterium]